MHRRLQNTRAMCVIQICDLSVRMVQDCIGLALCVKHCILSFVKLLIIPEASAWTVEGFVIVTVLTHEAWPCCQLHTKSYPTYFLQGYLHKSEKLLDLSQCILT
jgi:hypothetical protein